MNRTQTREKGNEYAFENVPMAFRPTAFQGGSMYAMSLRNVRLKDVRGGGRGLRDHEPRPQPLPSSGGGRARQRALRRGLLASAL